MRTQRATTTSASRRNMTSATVARKLVSIVLPSLYLQGDALDRNHQNAGPHFAGRSLGPAQLGAPLFRTDLHDARFVPGDALGDHAGLPDHRVDVGVLVAQGQPGPQPAAEQSVVQE